MPPRSKPEFPPMFGPGFHPMTLAEVRARCVDAFPLSRTRGQIMKGLEAVVGRLTTGGIVGTLWIDGSFLTQKIDPEDVDLLLRLPGDFLENATAEQQAAFDWYAEDDRKTSDHCDCYWLIEPASGVTEHTGGDLEHLTGEWMLAYWIRQFGFSRGDDLKGIATVELRGGAS